MLRNWIMTKIERANAITVKKSLFLYENFNNNSAKKYLKCNELYHDIAKNLLKRLFYLASKLFLYRNDF